jgi:hypothetical protein
MSIYYFVNCLNQCGIEPPQQLPGLEAIASHWSIIKSKNFYSNKSAESSKSKSHKWFCAHIKTSGACNVPHI